MRTRNKRLWVHLNDEEYDNAISNINKTGLSKEACIRSLLNGFVPREKPGDEFFASMRMLAGLANNINQLARHVNKYDSDVAWTLFNQADEWGRLQVELREKFLLPEKM